MLASAMPIPMPPLELVVRRRGLKLSSALRKSRTKAVLIVYILFVGCTSNADMSSTEKWDETMLFVERSADDEICTDDERSKMTRSIHVLSAADTQSFRDEHCLVAGEVRTKT